MAVVASLNPHRGPVHHVTYSHRKQGSWDLAVPVTDPSSSYEQEPLMSSHVEAAHSSRQHFTSQANGFAKPFDSSHWDSQDQYGDHIPQHSASDANRKVSMATRAKAKKTSTKPGLTDPNRAAAEHDENNWIHRDKLKEIETRELEEAGFRVGRRSRSNSRARVASQRSRDRSNSGLKDLLLNGEDRHEPRKVVSPIPADDEEPVDEYDHWNSPPLDEMVPETQTTPRANHTVRPSTSRIPLPKISGLPASAPGAERDSPQSRSRAGSTSWAVESNASNGLRGRSGSTGSQTFYDETESILERTPPQGHRRKVSSSDSGSPPKSAQPSPKKAKTANKPSPSSATRKASVKKTQSKYRTTTTTTTTSPPKRPSTSGGPASRPTTSSRPEGEAPWIATMYKPDPRLPPDQQIIPTHAKRMQQEQWKNEGRVGSMYDKDFHQLNNDMPDMWSSQNKKSEAEEKHESDVWPLPSPTKQPSSPEKDDRNATRSPNFELSGYKLTPTISHTRAPSPKTASPIAFAPSRPSAVRLQESKEEEAKPKKGCCCIVM